MSETEAPGVGHNSTDADQLFSVSIDKLRSLVERIERLDEEVKGLRDDQKDIFTEAKSAGYDVKVLRQLLALRRRDPAEVAEQEAVLDTYRNALGM